MLHLVFTVVVTPFQTTFIEENLVAVLHRIKGILRLKSQDQTAYPDQDPSATSPYMARQIGYGQFLPSFLPSNSLLAVLQFLKCQIHFPATLPLEQQDPIHAVGSTVGSSASVVAVAKKSSISPCHGATHRFSCC